ncbi:MAG: hypothetical protein HUJ29_05025 [Gammaproteobacteria bacterium]|nr:hypothetical protein [Gammaproteobacteria bacterium]
MTDHKGREIVPGHPSLISLHKQLQNSDQAYLLQTPNRPDQARFWFLGPFEGREIIWDALLMNFEAYLHHECHAGRYQLGDCVELQQFIEISERDIEPLPVTIVHDIPEINPSALLKTVIMLRNYKRLHRGRHQYGDTQFFKIDAD